MKRLSLNRHGCADDAHHVRAHVRAPVARGYVHEYDVR